MGIFSVYIKNNYYKMIKMMVMNTNTNIRQEYNNMNKHKENILKTKKDVIQFMTEEEIVEIIYIH